MDFQVQKQALCSCCVLREAKAEQPVDCDITLPDYCGDVKSILNCSIEPYLTSGGASGSRISAQGNAVVRLVYWGENDRIVCFEQTVPLSKSVEMSGLPQDAACRITAKTDYVNCRAVNPRRVDVHGCVTVWFTAFGKEKTEVLTDAPTDGVFLKREAFQTCDFTGCSSKLFEMSEPITVPPEKEAVRGVIHAEAIPTVKDTKAVNGKVLVRGDVRVSLCYGGENGRVERLEHTLPINQIAEVEGVTDTSLCDVRLSVTSLDAPFKADANGELRQADLAVTLRADVFAYQTVSVNAAADAYAVNDSLALQPVSAAACTLREAVDELFVVSCRLDFAEAPPAEVLDAWCDGVTGLFDETKPQFEVCGALSLCVLYRDEEGKPQLAHRSCDYRIQKELTAQTGRLVFDPWLCVNALELSGSGAGVQGRAQLHLCGCLFEKTQRKVIAQLQPDAGVEVAPVAAITVYFSAGGEEIWEIAKRYRTSCEAIRQRNHLSGERIENDGVLIIPRN